MANKKMLWQKKNVSHDEFEKEAIRLRKEINDSIDKINSRLEKEGRSNERIEKIDDNFGE